MRSRKSRMVGRLATAAAPILFAAVLLLGAPTAAQAAAFPDVSGDEWFAEAVGVLSDAGIVQGKDDGPFGPDDSLTRAQFAVLLSRSLRLPPGASHPFTDFSSGSWFEPEVAALFGAGVIGGITPTEFGPYARVSRQQAVSLVIRGLGYRLSKDAIDGIELTLTPLAVWLWLGGFPDRTSIAEVHQPAEANAFRLQIVSGPTHGRF